MRHQLHLLPDVSADLVLDALQVVTERVGRSDADVAGKEGQRRQIRRGRGVRGRCRVGGAGGLGHGSRYGR